LTGPSSQPIRPPAEECSAAEHVGRLVLDADLDIWYECRFDDTTDQDSWMIVPVDE
jgi:hypothetical protein